ncbi:MAG TPA: hypothetical protein VM532_06260 [Burkholderiales bacterium]|nr:hypothetical protein [Burkholderiales bacterium]
MNTNQEISLTEMVALDEQISDLLSLPADELNTRWREMPSEQQNLLATFLESADYARLFCALEPDLREPLWDRLDSINQLGLLRRLPPAIRTTQWETLSEAAQTALWLDLDPYSRESLLETLPEEHQVALRERIPNEDFTQVAALHEQLDQLRSLLSPLATEHSVRPTPMEGSPMLDVDAVTVDSVIFSEVINSLVSEGLFENELTQFTGEELRNQLKDIEEGAPTRLEKAQRDLENLPETATQEDRKEKEEALEIEEVIRDHLKDLAFVCYRANAAFLGRPDPVRRVVFTNLDLDKMRTQLARALEAAVESREVLKNVLRQSEQGTVHCDDNVVQVISAYIEICSFHEAQRYESTFEVLDNAAESQGRETSGSLRAPVVAGFPSDGESVEPALALEVEIGDEYEMNDTSKRMHYPAIAGNKNDFNRWRNIAAALRVNKGVGDLDLAYRLATPIVENANYWEKRRFDQREDDRKQEAERTGKTYKPREFTPLKAHFTTLMDHVMNDARWGALWRSHLDANYAAKFSVETNGAYADDMERAAAKSEALIDAEVQINEAARQGKGDLEIHIDGIGTVTAKNIKEQLAKCTDLYRQDEKEAKESVYRKLTAECLEAILLKKQVMAHEGETWKLVACGEPGEDEKMSWDKASASVQTQLDMLGKLRPTVTSIEIGEAFGPVSLPRIWMAATERGLAVPKFDETLLLAKHHKEVAERVSQALNKTPDDEAHRNEREQLRARLDEQRSLFITKRVSELRSDIAKRVEELTSLQDHLRYSLVLEHLQDPPLVAAKQSVSSLLDNLAAHDPTSQSAEDELKQIGAALDQDAAPLKAARKVVEDVTSRETVARERLEVGVKEVFPLHSQERDMQQDLFASIKEIVKDLPAARRYITATTKVFDGQGTSFSHLRPKVEQTAMKAEDVVFVEQELTRLKDDRDKVVTPNLDSLLQLARRQLELEHRQFAKDSKEFEKQLATIRYNIDVLQRQIAELRKQQAAMLPPPHDGANAPAASTTQDQTTGQGQPAGQGQLPTPGTHRDSLLGRFANRWRGRR